MTTVDTQVRVQVIDIAIRSHNDRRNECFTDGDLALAAFWDLQINGLLEERFKLTEQTP